MRRFGPSCSAYDTPVRTPPLDDLARAGRALWHDHNCQTCHQIYGFGGFLGPDVTNGAQRLGDADGTPEALAELRARPAAPGGRRPSPS